MTTAVMMHPGLFECDDRWVVLQTRSRQEKALAQIMEVLDVRFFLPLRRLVRYHGNRRRDVLAPLFAGYVFMRGDLDAVYRADRTRRVAQIVRVNDQRRLESEVRNLQTALQQAVPLDPHPYLKAGVRVEVRAGPFRGMRGWIDERAKGNRLIIQVAALGQATSLEIDGSLLEPVD